MATYQENWVEIVGTFEKTRSMKDEEKEIQPKWAEIFSDSEMFGYSRHHGGLFIEYKITLGSTPHYIDILLKSKESNGTCVIELKHDVKKNRKMEDQLISYIKQIRGKEGFSFDIGVGILISDKIYLYSYLPSRGDHEQKSIEIEFDKDSRLGPRFVEFLSHDNFDAERIDKWIDEVHERLSEVDIIRNSLTPENILGAVRDRLIKEGHSEEAVDQALKGHSFEMRSPCGPSKTPTVSPFNHPEETDTPPTNGNTYRLAVTKSGGEATMVARDGKYVVLAGSRYATKVVPSFLRHNYYWLRQDLERRGVMRDGVFTQDAPFNSLSAAAAVIMGRAANGREEWKSIGGGMEPRLP